MNGDAPIDAVEVSVDDGELTLMAPARYAVAVWQSHRTSAARMVRVRISDRRGRQGGDLKGHWHPGAPPPRRAKDGSDGDWMGTWLETAIPGTRLGAERNGRKW